MEGRWRSGLALRNSSDQVISDENDNCPDNGHEHAPYVEAGDPRLAEALKQPAANQASDNPKDDVDEEAFPLPIHDLAGDETSNQPEYDPAEN
jgi:hypothetical protein